MLELRNVSSGYPGLPVLFGVDLAVKEGELISVLGGNGAGKSTLLKTILGDVTVGSGEIMFRGQEITALPPHRRVAAGLSYSPEGRRVFPNLTARENLVAGAYGVPAQELADQLDVIYELFPLLAQRSEQRAGTLSGGEQQMLAVGRALMARPRLLMVEELSLGLAPPVVAHLYLALRALCEGGLAVLVAEQLHRFNDQHSDRWVILERGTVVAGGTNRDRQVLPDPAPGT